MEEDTSAREEGNDAVAIDSLSALRRQDPSKALLAKAICSPEEGEQAVAIEWSEKEHCTRDESIRESGQGLPP